MSTIGLAIIAKDEEEDLPTLLESIEGAFDRVVLLDTGSTDDTVDVFAVWSRLEVARNPNFTWQVGAYEWVNDFSDARNVADRLLYFGSTLDGVDTGQPPLVEWRCWADCDDRIAGATNLRSVVASADPQVTSFFAGYNYAQDPNGNCAIYLKRERLVRATYKHPWVGRVHEATPIIEGAVSHLPPTVAEWVHINYENGGRSNYRNLEILKEWNEDEPGLARVVGYLGIEHMVCGDFETAAKYFTEYMACDPEWDQEHAQMHRKLFQCSMVLERNALAEEIAYKALRVMPTWPDNYLSLSEWHLQNGEFAKALEWAKMAEGLGTPETMLIINPLDYTGMPSKLMALSLGGLGRMDEALAVGQKALEANPADQLLLMEMRRWQNVGKREHTAGQYVTMAQQLIAHDEQQKALELLECVPHFAYEHPAVVAKRTEIKTRLIWLASDKTFADHYEYGGSKPEDFIADENVEPLCEYLPRTQFLLAGLQEQLDEAGE